MKIRSLRTNHLTNPLGYAMTAPTFTWTAESSGKKQASARIQIAKDCVFAEIIYDSGVRADISSLGFTPEIELAARTRYFWRVEVTADNGDTAVSEPAWFETAKMDEAWSAQWICAPFDKDVHPIITRTISLRAKPVKARAYVTGLGVYELNINGRKAGDEVLAPFYNDYNNWIQYQTYDITDLLHEGENHVDA